VSLADFATPFLLRVASGSRSREELFVIGVGVHLPGEIMRVQRVGEAVWASPIQAAGEANAILAQYYEGRGAQLKILVVRDCEVSDAHLHYRGVDREAVNQALARNSNINVRLGVLEHSLVIASGDPEPATPPPLPGDAPAMITASAAAWVAERQALVPVVPGAAPAWATGIAMQLLGAVVWVGLTLRRR
jgi:hypothetical protein